MYGGFWLRAVACIGSTSSCWLIAATVLGALVGLSLMAIDEFKVESIQRGLALIVVLSWLYYSFHRAAPHSAMAAGLRVATGEAASP